MGKQALAEAAFLAGIESVRGAGGASAHWQTDFKVWYASRDPYPVATPELPSFSNVGDDGHVLLLSNPGRFEMLHIFVGGRCNQCGQVMGESLICPGHEVRSFGTSDAGGTAHIFPKKDKAQ